MIVLDCDPQSEFCGMAFHLVGPLYADLWYGNWCPKHKMLLVSATLLRQ
jgi:hypothetical protein